MAMPVTFASFSLRTFPCHSRVAVAQDCSAAATRIEFRGSRCIWSFNVGIAMKPVASDFETADRAWVAGYGVHDVPALLPGS
jgi:hypothetical protein